MHLNKFWKFILSLTIALSAGWIGSFFTSTSVNTWYRTLEKPALMPPDWAFGLVWTVLNILIGISLYLAWSSDWKVVRQLHPKSKRAWNKWSEKFWRGPWKKWNVILVFLVQYKMNIGWSVAFFGLKSPIIGFFAIIGLWVSIVYVIANFYRISKAAAWLLLPYLLWVSFALYLNLEIVKLN